MIIYIYIWVIYHFYLFFHCVKILGKKHQINLARRAAKESLAGGMGAPQPKVSVSNTARRVARIGRPGYRVTKIRDIEGEGLRGLLVEVDYPEIQSGTRPFHRVMSCFEQKVESPPDSNYQYLLFGAVPYETIAFKIPNMEAIYIYI